MIPPYLRSLVDDFDHYAMKIGVRAVVNTTAQHDSSAHVEMINGKYHYIRTERGNEYEHRVSAVKDDVLYWLLSDLTFSIAAEYEVAHRAKGQDSRRMLFGKQIELLEKLKTDWAARRQEEINNILRERPFDDPASEAAERVQHSPLDSGT